MRPPSGLPADLHATLTRLSDSERPILVGPWVSEVGYELLYWIPFLAWAQARYRIDPSRVVVVSRGGCASWYAHVTARYLDILEWFTLAEFRRANEERARLAQTRKHPAISDLDRRIVAHVEAVIGPCDLLHPSLLYRTFKARKPWTAATQAYARHQPMQAVEPWPGLPDRYVAVRFYASSICPDTPDVLARIAEMVRGLARTTPVVLLMSGQHYDDHHDFLMAIDAPGVSRVDASLTPALNLEVQTRVIAGASRFVGTYGGFAYLAPLLGVPADTVYVSSKAMRKLAGHVPLAQQVFSSDPRFGALLVLPLDVHAEAACA